MNSLDTITGKGSKQLCARDYGVMLESPYSATLLNPLDFLLAAAYLIKPSRLSQMAKDYFSGPGKVLCEGTDPLAATATLEQKLGHEHKLWWGSTLRTEKANSIKVYGDAIIGTVASKTHGWHNVSVHSPFMNSNMPYHQVIDDCKNAMFAGLKMQISNISILDFHSSLLLMYAKEKQLTTKDIFIPFRTDDHSLIMQSLFKRYWLNDNRAAINKWLLGFEKVYHPKLIEFINSGRATFQAIPNENFYYSLNRESQELVTDILRLAKSKGFGDIRYVLENAGTEYEELAVKTDRKSDKGIDSLRIIFPFGLPILIHRIIGNNNPDIFREVNDKQNIFSNIYLIKPSLDDCTRKITYCQARLLNPRIFRIPDSLRAKYTQELKKNFSRGKFEQRLIAASKRGAGKGNADYKGISEEDKWNILNFYWPRE